MVHRPPEMTNQLNPPDGAAARNMGIFPCGAGPVAGPAVPPLKGRLWGDVRW